MTYPKYKGIDLLVESHECLFPGITEELTSRFSPSHNFSLVYDDG